jgi:hypothetical protein
MSAVRSLSFAFTFGVFASFAAAQNSLSESEIRALLENARATFEDRPSFSVEFVGEYNLASGIVGVHASRAEIASGEFRIVDGRVEKRQVDDKWDERSQKFVRIREERSVWADGRTVGLRRFLASPVDKQPFTTVKKYHDSVRPDFVGWYADGIILDSEHYSSTLLRSESLNAVVGPSQGGAQQLHISGTCAEGQLDVWLTANERHDLVKARFVTNSAYAMTLIDVSSATIEIESIEYTEVDGVRLPLRAKAIYTFDVPGHGRIVKAVSVTRSNYNLNPGLTAPESFELPLADGDMVEDYDDPDVKWEWRDGKLMPLS